MQSRTLLAAISLAAVLTTSLSWRHEPPALFTFQYQYAAKVVCGKLAEGYPNVPQLYATSINVNNSSDSLTVYLRKRPVLTFPKGFQVAQQPLKPLNDSLLAKWALMTDCADLRRRFNLAPPFFEGFVVIQSTLPLDVTEVFTVPGGIDVVQVAERKIFVGQ